MVVVAGRRDRSLGCARCRPMIVVGLDEAHGPRAIEGARPGRVWCVRNVETRAEQAKPDPPDASST